MSTQNDTRIEKPRRLHTSGLFAFGLLLLASTFLCAASPSLGSIIPRGGQRGTELELNFNGARLGDVKDILFYSPGFSLVELKVTNPKHVLAKIKIAPECRLGVHAMRLRTATGISDMKTFFVGALVEVPEKEPNSDFATPQKIALNSTVSGIVQSEDVDYYVFEVKKGQRISAEIEGMRLGNTVFDPYIAIMNSGRFEIASSDDSALLRQDSTCQVIAPEDGSYYVQVRESSYGGNGNCRYRLHVGTFPRPMGVLPAGAPLGQETEVTYLGDAGGSRKQKITTPQAADEDFGLHLQDAGGVSPSRNLFRLSKYDNTLEVEPNNNHAKATVGPAPGAFNGIISEPGDVDCFRFKANKGQVFEVELYGRRIRSPLDSVTGIAHFSGKGITGNDDSRGPDSYFRFTAPETKEYVLTVRDHLGKGGPNYVYRFELTPVKPGLSLTIPRVARYSQERQSIAVPRGNRYTALVSVSRRNFGGDLAFSCAELPGGITIQGENMPANLTTIPVLFEAAADAPLSGKICDVRASHVDEKKDISGGFRIGIDLLVGSPGQSVYLNHTLKGLAVAVTEEAPFKLRIVEPKVPIVRNGSMALKIVAERKEGFTSPIALQMVFNPPGVTSQRGVNIAKDKNEAIINLNANGGAQVRAWKIAVNGSSGGIWASTQLATLRVAEPYIDLAAEKSSVEQGQATEIYCKINQRTKFEGKARLTLFGLPHNVKAPGLEIDSASKEVTFKVAVAKDSPAGKHRTIACRVEIVQNGESIVHATGGTELRIDKPLPPPKPKKKPPAKVVKKVEKPKPPSPPKAPPKKRLTRLEKLRLQFKKSKEDGS